MTECESLLKSIGSSTTSYQSFLSGEAPPKVDSGLLERLKKGLTIARTTRLEVRLVKVYQKVDWNMKTRSQKMTTYTNEFISQENKPPALHASVQALVESCKKAASKSEDPEKPDKPDKVKQKGEQGDSKADKVKQAAKKGA